MLRKHDVLRILARLLPEEGPMQRETLSAAHNFTLDEEHFGDFATAGVIPNLVKALSPLLPWRAATCSTVSLHSTHILLSCAATKGGLATLAPEHVEFLLVPLVGAGFEGLSDVAERLLKTMVAK